MISNFRIANYQLKFLRIILFFVLGQLFLGCHISRYKWHFDYPETTMPIQGKGWYKKMGNDSLPVGVWKKYSLYTTPEGKQIYHLVEKTRFEVDSNGSWHPKGIYKGYYGTNGKMRERSRSKNGMIIGKETIYFEKGGKSSVLNYDGVHWNPIGKAEYFYPNGKLKETGIYGAPAKVVVIDTINKKLIPYDSTQYYNSSKMGIWQEFYSNGKLKASGSYLPLISYKMVPYSNDLGNGLVETTPLFEFVYPKEGIWKYYDETGKFDRWEKYVNGFITASGRSESEIVQ